MKRFYTGISKLISDGMPGIINWIDLDTGQLVYATLRPALDFPALLINVDYPQCDGIGPGKQQRCYVEINLQVVFEVWNESNMNAPEEVREKALNMFDVIEQLHICLHGQKIESGEQLFRASVRNEKREDGLKVFNLLYKTKTTE